MRRWPKIALALVALLAVAVTFNTLSVNSQTEPARAEAGGGRVLELPGGDLAVREEGDPKAPPLVLLHGFAGSMRWWDSLVERLGDRFRIVRIDLLGHGGSEKPRHGYSMPEQARLVALALGKLDVEGATVVGHSMGGVVGAALAGTSSELVDRLALIDTQPTERYVDESLLEKVSLWPVLGQALYRIVPDGAVRKGLEDAFAPGFEVPDRFVGDFRRLTWSSYKESRGEIRDFVAEQPLGARIAAAAVPLLVIFGGRDRLVRPAAAEDYRDVPGARIATIPEAGHSPQVEAPEQTARLILEFAREAGDE